MNLGLGLGSAAARGGPNPNRLLWTEEMQRAEWTTSGAGVIVTPDDGLDPLGGSTADRLAFGGIGAIIGQTTDIAATTGAAVVSTITMAASWDTRHSLTGTFDGVAYYLSVWLNDAAELGIQLRLERVGGFLRASLRDLGDSPSPLAWGWKLETPTLTDYVKREGT